MQWPRAFILIVSSIAAWMDVGVQEAYLLRGVVLRLPQGAKPSSAEKTVAIKGGSSNS